ncbi:MAG: sigma-70 family RNA polymerase sigma factor [Gemmatimonadetes bacterium]|nr:sigma-70 family RNA polymerase sigma factor [Gemmatimonadota bacterium]
MTQSNDAAAADFKSLLEPVLEPAYRTAYHLTRNEADAEELVQEAALLAFKGFGRFRPGTNFKAWFFTILRNRFISTYRKKQREIKTVELEDAPELYMYTKSMESGLSAQTSEPAKYVIEQLDAEQVATALSELPMEFREAATLYFTQDMSYHDIAEVLGVPVGTVRSRLHRGRKLLQKKLWHLAEDYGLVPQPGAVEGAP